MQTDAPINPGNNGGALVDRNGNLVGINTFILSKGGGSEGLGFATPQLAVRFAYQEFKRFGRIRQTYIAADGQTITSDLAAGLRLPQDWGVVVSDVVPEGPAYRSGLPIADIVASVDGRRLSIRFRNSGHHSTYIRMSCPFTLKYSAERRSRICSSLLWTRRLVFSGFRT
jgi:S1-C subfamily serine protease